MNPGYMFLLVFTIASIQDVRVAIVALRAVAAMTATESSAVLAEAVAAATLRRR